MKTTDAAIQVAKADTSADTSHWLMHVPVPLFAVVMGVAGLGIAWRKAHHTLGVSPLIGELVLLLATVLFGSIAVLYALKLLRHADEVRDEFRHPVRANFFPAFSVSLLLLAAAALPYSRLGATVLFAVGAALHLTFTIHLLGRWITRNYEIKHSNPAWFIPVVGNILVPIPGTQLGYVELSWFFFAVGLVFWIVLFTILFYRIVFHDQMPAKIVPTLFIFIAPPSIGFLSYVGLTGGPLDGGARILIYVALLLTLLLLSLYRQFLSVPFAVSWWAYTFPLDSVATASLEFAELAGADLIQGVGTALLALATGVVTLVLVRTLTALMTGALFVPE